MSSLTALPIYYVDIISDVVASVEADVLDTIKSNETAAIGNTSIQTINYQYGHKAELVETLAQMDKQDPYAFQKYPLVFLVQDFRESVGGTPGIYGTANLNLIFMHQSRLDYKTTDRYTNVFKPVLYPILISFMKYLSKHKAVHVQNVQSLVYDKYDRPLVGVPNATSGNKLSVNDYVDAIEISNLNLLLNYQTCIN
jgi:hypothetical protein